jgi:hypothetical protein
MTAQPMSLVTENPAERSSTCIVVDLDQLDTATTIVRAKPLEQRWVTQLCASAPNWPPILVTDTLQVLDGHHRVAAARRLGKNTISATILSGLGPAEALEAAIAANATHGLALSRDERRRLVDRLLHAAPEWSDRRIAVAVAVSPTTVGKRRRAHAESEPPPSGVQDGHPARRIGRDGKAYPVPGVQVDTWDTPSEGGSARRGVWHRARLWLRKLWQRLRDQFGDGEGGLAGSPEAGS